MLVNTFALLWAGKIKLIFEKVEKVTFSGHVDDSCLAPLCLIFFDRLWFC